MTFNSENNSRTQKIESIRNWIFIQNHLDLNIWMTPRFYRDRTWWIIDNIFSKLISIFYNVNLRKNNVATDRNVDELSTSDGLRLFAKAIKDVSHYFYPHFCVNWYINLRIESRLSVSRFLCRNASKNYEFPGKSFPIYDSIKTHMCLPPKARILIMQIFSPKTIACNLNNIRNFPLFPEGQKKKARKSLVIDANIWFWNCSLSLILVSLIRERKMFVGMCLVSFARYIHSVRKSSCLEFHLKIYYTICLNFVPNVIKNGGFVWVLSVIKHCLM